MLKHTRLFGLALPMAAYILAGCSGGAGSSSGASAVGSNIYGTASSSSGSVSKLTSKLARNKRAAQSITTLPNCTVTAQDLTTGSVVATTTTDANGNYTLLGVTSGTTYKVIVTCGPSGSPTYVLSSVASADTTQPSAKTPIVTNPRSTLIAAQIITAVLTAVTNATTAISGANQAVKDAVTASILASIQSLAATIENTIDQAITSGAMPEPTASAASSIGSQLTGASTTAAINTSVTTYASVPASISNIVTGAASSASALPACDSTLNVTGQPIVASAQACTGAFAKLVYNVLSYPVALDMSSSGGLYSLINGNCSITNTNLVAAFPNAVFSTPVTGFCQVTSKIHAVDRNQGTSTENNGNGNNNTVFAETGHLDGGTGTPITGVLTAVGSQMFAKTSYHLSDLDKNVFSYDATTKSGFNMRLIASIPNYTNYTTTFEYYNSASVWTASGWLTTCNLSTGAQTGGSDICTPDYLNWSFSDNTWASETNTTSAALAALVAAGSDLGLNVFFAKYGGAVPSEAQLDTQLNSGRVHIDHNPNGEREFYVMYSGPTFQGSGSASDQAKAQGCWDNDPTTPCYAADGVTAYPAQRADITLAGTAGADGVKRIASISLSATGAYFVVPVYNYSSWSGAFTFIKVADGTYLVDDLFRNRVVQTAFTSAACDGTHLPTAGANCAAGYLFNAVADYSTCNGPTSVCPTLTYMDTTTSTPVTNGSTAINTNPTATYPQNFVQWFSGNNQTGGHNLLAKLTTSGLVKLQITLTSASSDVISAVGTGDASMAQLKYNVGVHMACTTACVVDGFYLVDENGHVYTNAMATSVFATGAVCQTGPTGFDCSAANVVKYTDSTTATYGFGAAGYSALDFDSATGGTQSFATAYRQYQVPQGPVPNPGWTCSGEPFFIDGNGNNQLDCTADDSDIVEGSLDISFSSLEDYNRWVNAVPALAGIRAARHLQSRNNGYSFGDPVGTKKLMTTAFGGWFDGSHVITTSTSLNALQNFAFVFLFFSEGGGDAHPISNLPGAPTGASDQYFLQGPGANSFIGLNQGLGNAIINFHQ